MGGWGLGSRNRRGPAVPPTPGLRGQSISPGSPAGFLGSSGGGANSFLSSLAPLVWGLGGPLPPASPDLPSLRGTDLTCPPLLLSSPLSLRDTDLICTPLLLSLPVCPTSSLWGSSCLLGAQSSPPAPAGTLAVGRR